jgi:hypothetical protein
MGRQALLALTTVLGALLMAESPRLEAQVRGIPVYNLGVPSGLGIYGDVAFPNAQAGSGTAYAISGRLGFGALGVTAIFSSLNPDGPASSDLSIGATLNYKIFGGPLVPLGVTLQGGVGYAKPDSGLLPGQDTELRIPLGVGFALTIPNPVLAIVPWIAPRLDMVRISGDNPSNTETNFGLSSGIEFNLLNGFGLHAAYDRVFLDGEDPTVFGLGVHYGFRIPGL